MKGQALAAVLLKGFGVGSAMLLQWLVVRLYGPSGQGLFGLMATTLSLGATIAVFGQDYLSMRNISGDIAEGKVGLARAQAKTSVRIVVVGSILVSLALVVTALVFKLVLIDNATALILLAGLPAAAALAIARVYSFVARASGNIFKSQLIDGPIPSGLGVLLVAGLFLVPTRPPVWVLGLTYAIANLAALAMGLSIGRKAVAGWPKSDQEVAVRPLLVAGISRVFGYASPFFIDWLIIFTMTGTWGTKAAGLARIPALFINAMFLIAVAFDAVFAPRIAAAIRLGDMATMKRLYRNYVRGSLALNVPVAAILLAAPGFVLGVFGAEFVPLADALRVGVVLQLLTIMMGPAGLLLVMSKNEPLTYASNSVAIVAVLAVCAFVIPQYGIAAGVIAGSAVGICRRLAELTLASRKLRVNLLF